MDIKERLVAAHEEHYPAIAALLAQAPVGAHGPNSALATMCTYHLATGGKRLRALIPVLVCETLGGKPDGIYPFAASCEMLHNATLVHDDLQDGDTHRRGSLTVWKQFGTAQAINVGDAMLFYALSLLDRLEVPAQVLVGLRQLVIQGSLDVIEGQAREFELKRTSRPGLDDYFRMVKLKTSALFALPLVGAAALAGGSQELVAALSDSAEHLGVLFQIQDDVLDILGDKGRGERGSDIEEGKLSALAVHALANGSPADRERLADILGTPRGQTLDDDKQFVTGLFRTCGSLDACLDEIRRRAELAGQSLDSVDEPLLGELVSGLAKAFVSPIEHLMTSSTIKQR